MNSNLFTMKQLNLLHEVAKDEAFVRMLVTRFCADLRQEINSGGGAITQKHAAATIKKTWSALKLIP